MQNAFNSPRAQLRRLRKAGLPLAYMYGGNVATQSEVPRLSLDNDLGASEQQNLNLQRELQNAQIPKIISEKEFQDLMNEIKGGEAEWLKMLVGEVPPGGVDTNQQFLLNLNKQAQLTKSWITDNSRQLQELNLEAAKKLFGEDVPNEIKRKELTKLKQQITNLISQNDLMKQLHDIRTVEETVNAEFTEALNGMDDWGKAWFSVLMKLFKPNSTR